MSDWRDVPCKEWQDARDRHGYGARRYKGKKWAAHRAQWDEEVGPIPAGLHVLHRCDNPPCHEVRHLFLGTAQDNMRDKVSKRRQQRGERVPQHKLTEQQVGAIRRRYAAGHVTQQQLADEYGIARSSVSRIVSRKQWAHA